MRRLALSALGALALLASTSADAAAQNTCELVYQNGPWTSIGDPASRVISADGPLLVRCAAGEELRADSAVIYQTINEVHLFGQVDYQDPGRSLTSDNATYSSATGRLYATGNVVFTDKNRGSTLRGPELEYYRAKPPERVDAQAIATGRPHLTVTPKRSNNGSGSDNRRREPMEIDADRITSVGERYMTAEGNVIIVQEDTRSTAEEAFYDATEERVELRRNARVDGKEYDLAGNFIESRLKDGSLSQVLARTNARLESEKLTATGPQLQLFFERDLLQRTIASREPGTAVDSTTPAPRSVALSKGFRMEADSIEAVSPDQQLRQVNAIGKAQGVSWDTVPAAPRRVTADSAGAAVPIAVPVANRPVDQPPEGLEEKDVLTADTIIAFFRPDSAGADSVRGDSARGDSTAGPRVLGDTARGGTAGRDTADTVIERLLAIGDARSLYRMRDDSVKAGLKRGGLNYLVGDRIDLAFKDGEVDVAHVRGLKKGVYLDPQSPADSAAADSASADSAGARRGTPGARGTGAATTGGASRRGQTPQRPAGQAPRPQPAAPAPTERRTLPAGGRP